MVINARIKDWNNIKLIIRIKTPRIALGIATFGFSVSATVIAANSEPPNEKITTNNEVKNPEKPLGAKLGAVLLVDTFERYQQQNQDEHH